MATVVFYFPLLRSIMGWLTGMPATYSNLKRHLTSGSGATFGAARHPGRNCYMLPGGLAEIFTAQPNTHTIVWRPRRGLCRLALETGARLTPMYVFGGNDFFHQSGTDDSRLSRASRACGMSLTCFWGRRTLTASPPTFVLFPTPSVPPPTLPLSPGSACRYWWLPPVPLIPPHGVTIAIAEPLPSRRAAAANGTPTPEEIDTLHEEYEVALRAVFDEYKEAAGYPDAELIVK